jgi:hypothetical protein
MSFDELLRMLPNRLHDAELTELHVDFARATVTCDVSVDIGEYDDTTDGDGDYRAARLTFSGVSVVALDPPGDPDEPFGVSRIDAESGQPRTAPRSEVKAPVDGFVCWLFAARWNGFLRIGARDVSLAWADSSH